jgi:hypothetical protein
MAPRKTPKATDDGPKPPPDFVYCLGKRVEQLRDHPSAAFASTTKRNAWRQISDVPHPGYTFKVQDKSEKVSAFPEIKEWQEGQATTGFGSTTPRDLTYSLTNGEIRDASKAGQSNRRSHGPQKVKTTQPAGKTTVERMPLYSSFSPTPYGAPSTAERSSSWALSGVERDPYEISRVKRELKARSAAKKPGLEQQKKPKRTEKDWIEEARKEVERRSERRDTSKPAFGTSGTRMCLHYGKPNTAPAPGQYTVL